MKNPKISWLVTWVRKGYAIELEAPQQPTPVILLLCRCTREAITPCLEGCLNPAQKASTLMPSSTASWAAVPGSFREVSILQLFHFAWFEASAGPSPYMQTLLPPYTLAQSGAVKTDLCQVSLLRSGLSSVPSGSMVPSWLPWTCSLLPCDPTALTTSLDFTTLVWAYLPWPSAS